MCGVGGVFFKTTEHHRKTGEIAYHVLDGIYRRGPDSTGLAFVQPASEDRLYIGINCEEPGGGRPGAGAARRARPGRTRH